MYKSPIEKIYGDLQTQMVQEDENMMMKAVRKVGVNVDKEELIKALQYDREQYKTGYADGKNDVLVKIRAEIEQMPSKLTEDGRGMLRRESVFWIINKYMTENVE